MNNWLFKTEPGCFSLDDLLAAPGQTSPWDGVRNFQARNLMRDMKTGDRGFFYHSGKNPAVVAIVSVAREAYPDHTQFDPANRHYDPQSSQAKPRWYMVDVHLERALERPVTLAEMRAVAGLEDMALLRRGNRLSVQPVSDREFEIIVAVAATAAPTPVNAPKARPRPLAAR